MGVLDPSVSSLLGFLKADVLRNQDAGNLVAVATDADWYDGGPYTAGVNTFQQSKIRHVAVDDCTAIRFVYMNAYQRDSLPANNITIRAGIEVTGLTNNVAAILPVTFSGAGYSVARDVTLAPGQFAISDPVWVNIPAGSYFWSRTLVTVPSAGGYIPQSLRTTTNNWTEGAEAGTSYTDKTTSGTITAVSNQNFYGPCLVAGIGKNRKPFIGIDGDSIASGYGESAPSSAPYIGRGFIRRALNATIPYASTAASGAQQQDGTFYREFLLARCTDIICQGGINDLQYVGGQVLATFQAAAISIWKRRGARGARVWQTTITPRSSSTDSYATVGNQTPNLPAGDETVRTQYNDWLRDGAPILNGVAVASGSSAVGTLRAGTAGHPLAGYFDVADAVESSRNSGKWKVGYVTTADGLHPNATGHAAMAAVIDTSRFTVVI